MFSNKTKFKYTDKPQITFSHEQNAQDLQLPDTHHVRTKTVCVL